MAIITRKVSEFPVAADPRNVDVFGQDVVTGQSVKVNTEDLVGDTGPAPEITITVNTLPHGQAPTVDKTGTNEAPVFTIGFPLAKNGDHPLLQNNGTYIQYRYSDTETWQNLMSTDTLKLRFSDLTDADKAELKGDPFEYDDFTPEQIATLRKPATDAADDVEKAIENLDRRAEEINTTEQERADAEKARTLAEEKRAEDTAQRLEDTDTAIRRLNDLSDHQPGIVDGYWWIWDETTQAYVSTGQRADGNTLFAAFEVDPATMELAATTPDRYDGPTFELENGNLNVIL